MVELSAFALCAEIIDNISADGVLEPELKNPQPALRPAFVPTEYSFGVYLGLLGVGAGAVGHDLEFVLDDAEEKTVAKIGPVSIPPASPNGSNIPPENSYVAFVLRMQNVKLETEGVYKFRTLVDGEEIGSRRVPVYRSEASA